MWVDIQQNTDEWLDMRMGKIGGSAIGKVMANYGKAFGDPAHREALRIALEKITGIRNEQKWSNDDLLRGHEQEPLVRSLYQEKYFCEVSNGGYFVFDEYTGVSPDGLIYDDGIIEIKSVIGPTFFDTIKRNSYDPKYKWQLWFNLMVSGREWIDYVEGCLEFPPGKQLFVQRLTVSDSDCSEMFDMIKNRLFEFKKLIKDKIEIIGNI